MKKKLFKLNLLQKEKVNGRELDRYFVDEENPINRSYYLIKYQAVKWQITYFISELL